MILFADVSSLRCVAWNENCRKLSAYRGAGGGDGAGLSGAARCRVPSFWSPRTRRESAGAKQYPRSSVSGHVDWARHKHGRERASGKGVCEGRLRRASNTLGGGCPGAGQGRGLEVAKRVSERVRARRERGRGVCEGRLRRARGREGTGAAAGAEPDTAQANPGGGLRSILGLGGGAA